MMQCCDARRRRDCGCRLGFEGGGGESGGEAVGAECDEGEVPKEGKDSETKRWRENLSSIKLVLAPLHPSLVVCFAL